MITRSRFLVALGLSVVGWPTSPLLARAASAEPVAFTADRWDLADAAVAPHLGRDALSGTAVLKNVVFENGIIEVDIATDHQRSYPGIVFRRQSETEYERVYLRPHRAGHYPDAIQYVPAFNGVDSWQLYSGRGFTAGATLPAGQWVHVRVEVAGTQARVFVGDGAEPALVIDELQHGAGKGALGLTGPRDGTAFFSNFTWTPSDALRFDPPPPVFPPAGLVTDWTLSQPVRPPGLGPERYPDAAAFAAMQWLPVKSAPSGLVDIARHRKPFPGGGSRVYARTTIRAERKESRPFAFGYSDNLAIHLNGQLVFRGFSGYRQRDPSFLGIVGWNDVVALPLEPGDNELVFVVSEVSGGWGFMCRDLDAVFRHPSLTPVWELSEQLRSPESVAGDAKRGVLFVSNLNGNCISTVGLDGKVLAREWATGLNRPTGLKLFRDKLYAVERPGVAEIDLASGAITNRFAIPGAGFANDLAIDAAGTIWVTDSLKGCLYRIVAGKAETWLQDAALGAANGLLVEPDRLLVGVTSDGSVKAVDLATKRISTFVTLGEGALMDGLVSDGKRGYLFSDYYGRLFHADASGRVTVLFDGTGPDRFCADFEYLPDLKLLVVPSLYDQRLTAFRLNLDAITNSDAKRNPP